nr:hypothetical protein [uncultured Flavobacterium sp.]
MKHYFIILALMLGVFANAQDKKDFKFRTQGATGNIENYQKKHSEKSVEQTFADSKLKKLELAIKLNEDQKIKLNELFAKQWAELKSSYDAFATGETAQNKVKLISTLLKIEDETRNALNTEQLTAYKAFNKNSTNSFDFGGYKMYFFPEAEYQEYKKLVQ